MYSVLGSIVVVGLLLFAIFLFVMSLKEQKFELVVLCVLVLCIISVTPIQVETIKMEPLQSIQLNDRVLFIVEDTVLTHKDVETYNNYKNVTINKEVYKSLIGVGSITTYTVTVKDSNVYSER